MCHTCFYFINVLHNVWSIGSCGWLLGLIYTVEWEHIQSKRVIERAEHSNSAQMTPRRDKEILNLWMEHACLCLRIDEGDFCRAIFSFWLQFQWKIKLFKVTDCKNSFQMLFSKGLWDLIEIGSLIEIWFIIILRYQFVNCWFFHSQQSYEILGHLMHITWFY